VGWDLGIPGNMWTGTYLPPFLPYDAVPIMKNEILEKYPELKEVLNRLSGKIPHKQMQQLNDEVDVEEQKPKR
jgi:glycine betaine/choline ABC-type transport system substrate-binding protein